MSTLTVTTTPQPIYPAGLQDAFSITNNGPWTVYLDSDTSVSVTQSIPLPPTATIVWDKLRPLYAVAAGDGSTLVMSRNGSVSNAGRASTSDLLASSVNVTIGGSLPGDLVTPRFETGSYETIVAEFTSTLAQAFPPTTTDYHRVTVTWFSKNGAQLSSQYFHISELLTAFGTPAEGQITLRVLGDYCEIRCSVTNPNAFMSWNISGTSRVLTNRVDWMHSDSVTYPAYVDPGTVLLFTGTDGYAVFDTWDMTGPILLNSLSTKVTVSVHISSNVTAAGVLRVRDYRSTAALVNIPIPVVAASQVITTQIVIPISAPIELRMITVPTTAGVCRVTIVQEGIYYG